MFLSTRTSNNRTWNTGNGSPDAICFSGKQIFLLIHKWIPMLFYITVSPLNFLVVNTVKCILGLIEFGNYCLYCTVRWLKVRKFQMQFMVSSIVLKNERKNKKNRPNSTMSSNCFRSIFVITPYFVWPSLDLLNL